MPIASTTVMRTASRSLLLLALLAVCIGTVQAQSLNATIEGIERHYNSLSALQMSFEQSIEHGDRLTMAESGIVYLLRPGKMRWDYERPQGKLAISDGEIFRMYSPNSNQVRQVALDEMTDLRAPLSFLLGRMRLRRMFRNLRIEDVDGKPALIGEGRNARDFYSRVEFEFDPAAFMITGIRIFGRDESVNVYRFWEERKNPKLAEGLFVFKAPPGADVVPLTRGFSQVPYKRDND